MMIWTHRCLHATDHLRLYQCHHACLPLNIEKKRFGGLSVPPRRECHKTQHTLGGHFGLVGACQVSQASVFPTLLP